MNQIENIIVNSSMNHNSWPKYLQQHIKIFQFTQFMPKENLSWSTLSIFLENIIAGLWRHFRWLIGVEHRNYIQNIFSLFFSMRPDLNWLHQSSWESRLLFSSVHCSKDVNLVTTKQPLQSQKYKLIKLNLDQ